MKIIITILIIAILISLGTALVSMLRGGDKLSDRMFKSLVIRVGLSVILFIFLMVAGYMGWITPNSVVPIK